MRLNTNRWIATTVAAGCMAIAGTTHAQPDQAASAAPEFEMPTYSPAWTSETIATAASMLSGSWSTSQPVLQAGEIESEDPVRVNVVMNVAPVAVDGVPNALYVELAREDSQHAPFRHAIFELFEYKDGIRLRTYEIAIPDQDKDLMTGLWVQPGYFPELSKADLVATMDVQLSAEGAGFRGNSPYPYPTGKGGAVEMTSQVELAEDRFVTMDQGMNADGEIAWRSNYVFVRGQPTVNVDIRDDGMVIVEYTNPGEVVVEPGDQMHVHYTGWMSDMSQFDASRPKGRPFVFLFPPGNQAIVGWGLGMEGMSIGTRRKLVIPSYLGYGERGNPRAGIAGGEDLYFEVECVHIDKPEPDTAEPVEADVPAEGGVEGG